MARTIIPLTELGSRAGVTAPAGTAADAVNGNVVNNDGHVWLRARNSGATSRNFTVSPSRKVDGLAVTAPPVALAAGATKVFGPYPVGDYGDDLAVDANHAEVLITAEHYAP